jgi:hypothetical protein
MAIQLQTTKESPCVVRRVEFYSAPPTIDYNITSELDVVIVTYRPLYGELGGSGFRT